MIAKRLDKLKNLNFYFEEDDNTPELDVELNDDDIDEKDYEQYEQEGIDSELAGEREE